jgi:hypothetical protein
MLDTSQLRAALQVIGKAERPLLFVYIHGWQNNALSGDVCRFEHFIDTMSRFPEMTGRKITVIGVYIGWRGRDLTVPGLNLLSAPHASDIHAVIIVNQNVAHSSRLLCRKIRHVGQKLV